MGLVIDFGSPFSVTTLRWSYDREINGKPWVYVYQEYLPEKACLSWTWCWQLHAILITARALLEQMRHRRLLVSRGHGFGWTSKREKKILCGFLIIACFAQILFRRMYCCDCEARCTAYYLELERIWWKQFGHLTGRTFTLHVLERDD